VLQTRPLPPGEAAIQRILELQRFSVPPGTYQLELQLSETGFPAADFRFRDSVRAQPAAAPYYSTLQLLDTFFAGSQPGPFLKNGRQQLPRSLNFLDEGQDRLHYYTELYHTDSVPDALYPLVQRVYVSKRKGDLPYARLQQYDTLRKGAAFTPWLNTFSTAALPGGNYHLQAELRDRNGRLLTSQSVFFQTINADPEDLKPLTADTGAKPAMESYTVFDLSKTFVAKYDPAQLRAILKMISPIADPNESDAINGFLKKPDEIYSRYFIYNFFSRRNAKSPEQAWKEFSDIVREVNKQFKRGSTMGYETDRGFVYLKYGKPDERIPVPNEAGALPYEIWRYNIIGNTGQNGTFLFYQPGYIGGDLKLLHSTVVGEMRNGAWRSMLYSTGHSSGNSNSRAEQYIGNK
jgi:GWxTD domain-containing protein